MAAVVKNIDADARNPAIKYITDANRKGSTMSPGVWKSEKRLHVKIGSIGNMFIHAQHSLQGRKADMSFREGMILVFRGSRELSSVKDINSMRSRQQNWTREFPDPEKGFAWPKRSLLWELVWCSS